MSQDPIRAVIGVWYRREPVTNMLQTFYVRRSESMKNYPGVWSLPSYQYRPDDLPDPMDHESVSALFSAMSRERFLGAPVTVLEFLTAGRSDDNPMGRMVELLLYRIAFEYPPLLHSAFYIDAAWLTSPEYELRTVGAAIECGLCTHLWRAYEYDTLLSTSAAS